ncbi:protein IQ-DOMAIN 1-like [Iris pallida]|uniref:Protein IQ-DOMAIN 1-like n=1 Tax=Iris pallida TaxID=29817 RepID=A0AAX6E3J0_IRIPA|nr:protein IQ-DOMAIN 1-like [Iris pallida]
MQTLARVQSQVRSRRIRMSEENQALQRQLLLKREKELENLRMGDEWDDSLQSKEQIEASLLSKQEAATRRERALAYAFTHQGKNSSKSANPMFMDPNNPHWGWSWLERWMAARPWESRSTTDKDPSADRASLKSAAAVGLNGGEITKAYDRRDSFLDKTSPATQKSIRPSTLHSPSTPRSKPPIAAAKLKSASPRMGWAPPPAEDDARSVLSMNSERPTRRHSIAGSSVGDDESLAGVPSYMAPTQSTRARSRFQSPSGDAMIVEGLDKVPAVVVSAKKRLSFQGSPAGGARRHSGPPKVDLATVKDVAVQ